jgi:hypothetical protein
MRGSLAAFTPRFMVGSLNPGCTQCARTRRPNESRNRREAGQVVKYKRIACTKTQPASWNALRCCQAQPVDGSIAAMPRLEVKLYGSPPLTRWHARSGREEGTKWKQLGMAPGSMPHGRCSLPAKCHQQQSEVNRGYRRSNVSATVLSVPAALPNLPLLRVSQVLDGLR